MDVVCEHCQALHWSFERLKESTEQVPKFSHCCHNGKVSLTKLPVPPDELLELLTGDSTDSRRFREQIRQYNCALAFTSFVAKETIPSGGGGPWIWKTGYTIYHQLGTLRPEGAEDPTYAQLYFYDPEDALDFRMKNNTNLKRETMSKLQDMLRTTHRYSPAFLHSFEILQNTPSRELSLRIVTDPSTDQRRYNVPSANEIAIVLPGDGTHAVQPRDVVLQNREGGLQFMHDHHPDYAPLHYVLLFPYGTTGWTYGLPLNLESVEGQPHPNSVRRQKNISQVQYYSYRLHVHQQEFPALHSGGRLFQQYVCDVWVSTDQSRLRWVEQHQAQLRASLYSGLEDAVGHGEADVELGNLGHRVVLPSSYIGGPRYMNQRFQDAIAVARHYRGFDLFVTFTCNANWAEIKQALLPGQTTADRPDLTVRVFNMYRSALIDEITKRSLFGTVHAYVYTIEFQKRGLPHMHLLISLSPNSKLSTAEEVDTMIRATWPDPETEPRLFGIVKRCMVHGPCGRWNPKSPCMKDGKCSKGFPKPFQAQTVMTNDGYPIYARPDDGRSYNVGNVFADNRWIVPYNPYVLAKYDAHINVESVVSLAAAKYITKYTHKGPDRATLQIQKRDEVSEFRDSRYIAASEATWRMFEFPIHHQEPSVISLQIHLPGQHMVVFNPNESPENVTSRAQQEKTMLTAFFDLNKCDPLAHAYTYQQIPEHYVWSHPQKMWKRRQRGSSIGRLYFVSPTAGERFYLRTLLTTVTGVTSWTDVRTFDGIIHATFHGACLARGLLADDNEWRECLQEASTTHLGDGLRRLFSLILRHCNPSQPDVLWQQFKGSLCDDLRRRLLRMGNCDSNLSDDYIFDYGLFLIDEDLRLHGSSLAAFPSMPSVSGVWRTLQENPFIAEQLNYCIEYERELSDKGIPLLNEEQRLVFDEIMHSTTSCDGKSFFLHGPGGTGKTFVYNTLCHHVRSNGWIVLCVASCGIASLLLPGGHTAHSTFAIPVENLCEDSCCAVDKNSKLGEMLRKVRLIIWDEAVTQHRHAIEAVDRMLQDVRSCTRPFGGITVVFGGDFQQTLPVVAKGSREEIVNATLQRSRLWRNIHVRHLRQNMRVQRSPDSHAFSQWLLDIGHGRASHAPNRSGAITIPSHMLRTSESDLINAVYGNIDGYSSMPTADFFQHRAILAPTNEDIRNLNSQILSRFPGDAKTFSSADTYSFESPDRETNDNIPLEFLHGLNPTGLPLAQLTLKIGCPIILLRNIDKKRGLCNGTRGTVLRMSNRLLEIRVISGDHAGETALIPRISLSPSLTGLDFAIKLNRRQFPIQLAFAMTINKAQGQTVSHVGIDLRKPVFSHGQLYVALSRATSIEHIHVLLGDPGSAITSNVVFPEILL